ncbi:MAG: hypothetical protein ACI4KR_05775 [Ruminiclostridium sp.]
MPHSGGGGSHSGGSHGGSHRSGGGSGSSNRVSSTYFRGAHRFMYYYNGRPVYYYANHKVTPGTKASGISLIVFSIMWLLMTVPMICALVSDIFVSGPLSLNYDTAIVIDDEIGIVEDKAELTDAFKAFQEKTGVTFGLVTRSPENVYMGSTYENQAYNCYVSRWDDEKHWLIYYVGSTLDRSDDWHWELMCGDDCTKILDSSIEKSFTNDLHRYLVAAERYTFDQAVLTAVNNIDVQPGSFRADEAVALIPALIFPIVGIAMLVGGILMVKKPLTPEEKAKSQAVEIGVNQVCQEVACEYCGGVYIKHTCVQCPHCGAPVKIDNNQAGSSLPENMQ